MVGKEDLEVVEDEEVVVDVLHIIRYIVVESGCNEMCSSCECTRSECTS